MGAMEDFLRLLGLTGDADPARAGDAARPAPRAPAAAPAAAPERPAAAPAVGRRRLEQTLRRLPDRYRDRLGPPALRQVTRAAAGGRWDAAVDHLVAALCRCEAPVTAAERQELRAVLRALDRPTDRVDALPRR
ncbi:hypothetical protein Acsp04_31350 [Actinomadura sp. NBRC 104425]|uniref:hypothetical protein n=1 Tax=Actinomadura sp. NBRC 104425 TaxID=3032204 RepID=UPI0024A2BB8A|nr:hypothetical protein [Actinomadura sp. NBRC 104425]GLZ12900.1 hypothetical protein Acsp04_31350 [Actinomadura sp. NBRC 104425]